MSDANPLENLKMYTGSLGEVSNREDWIVSFSFTGDDGTDFDLSTAQEIQTSICEVRDPNCPVLSAKLSDATITLIDNFNMQWHFAESDMEKLCPGSYSVFQRIQVAGFWTQSLSASIVVVEGGPRL